MIIADTCVLSEPLRATPDTRVIHWLAAHSTQVCTTAITAAELHSGAQRLPQGRRRQLLSERINAMFSTETMLAHPFDAAAAQRYARTRATREARGHPLAAEDGMIAAIAYVHGAAVATRNTRDFTDLGVEVLNPWDAP